jgi:hypothetical protein
MQIQNLEVKRVKNNMIDPKTKEVYEIGVIRSAQLGQFIGKKVNIEVTEVN